MTISNVYLIFWGPFKFGGPVRSHGPHVPRYGPGSSLDGTTGGQHQLQPGCPTLTWLVASTNSNGSPYSGAEEVDLEPALVDPPARLYQSRPSPSLVAGFRSCRPNPRRQNTGKPRSGYEEEEPHTLVGVRLLWSFCARPMCWLMAALDGMDGKA